MSKVVLPGQQVPVDTPSGVDPIWYEKFTALVAFANLFNSLEAFNYAGGHDHWQLRSGIDGGVRRHAIAKNFDGRCHLCSARRGLDRTREPPAKIMLGSFQNGTTEDLVFGTFLPSTATVPLFQQNISGSGVD